MAVLLVVVVGSGWADESSAPDRLIGQTNGVIAFGCDSCPVINSTTIWVVRADGSGLRQLTKGSTDYYPAWSPNGRTLAFVDNPDNGTIQLVNGNGSGRRPLPGSPVTDQTPSWSPGGKKLVYAGVAGGLYTIDTNGRGRRRLTGGFVCCPACSPDGHEIVYGGFTPGRSLGSADQLFVISADGRGRRLLVRSLAGDRDPVWSPDGKLIAFLRGGGDDCTTSNDVYLMNADGGGQRRLTNDSPATNGCTGGKSLAGSPDGKALAFVRKFTFAGPGGIGVISIDGKTQQQIPNTARFSVDGLSWQPLPRGG